MIYHTNSSLPRRSIISNLCLVLFFSCCTQNALCQQQKKMNSIYGGYISEVPEPSINYDHVFSHGAVFTKSYRIGLSVYNNYLALPLGVQFFTGKEAHHFEMSLTFQPYVEKYDQLFAGNNLSDKKMNIMTGVGYRYQKSTAGFFGKIIIGPMLLLDPASDNFWRMEPSIKGGISIGAGYSF